MDLKLEVGKKYSRQCNNRTIEIVSEISFENSVYYLGIPCGGWMHDSQIYTHNGICVTGVVHLVCEYTEPKKIEETFYFGVHKSKVADGYFMTGIGCKSLVELDAAFQTIKVTFKWDETGKLETTSELTV